MAPFTAAVDLAAVPRPADAQGGVRRRADDPGRDHRPVSLCAAEPPLDPSGDEARVAAAPRAAARRSTTSATCGADLRLALRRLEGGPRQRHGTPPPLSTFAAMVIFVGLALPLASAGLAGPAHRPGPRTSSAPVLTDEVGDRRRAAVPRRARPWPTAHHEAPWSTASARSPSVRSSAAGSTTTPARPRTRWRSPSRRRSRRAGTGRAPSAALFDAVLYGDRPATRDQAVDVLALDDGWRAPMSTATRSRLPGDHRRRPLTLAPAPLVAGDRRRPLVAARRRRRLLRGRRRPDRDRRSTPTTPDADGARAVARVLDDQGRRGRRRPRRRRLLDRADARTVDHGVVTSTYLLGEQHRPAPARRARRRRPGAWPSRTPAAIDAARRSTPGPGRSRPDGDRAADCADPLFDRARSGSTSDTEYATGDGECFRDARRARAPGGEPRDRASTLLGAVQAAHQRPGARGPTTPPWRCACSASTTGWSGTSRRSTTWSATTASACGRLLPDWIVPGLWIAGAIAMLALLLWRVRRLGPLVIEPLPVDGKAIETTRSRGRLYRKAGDRAHAAEALRRAARTPARRPAPPRHRSPTRRPGPRRGASRRPARRDVAALLMRSPRAPRPPPTMT